MKILVPVDSSPASHRALAIARDYVEKFPAELHIVNVQNEPIDLTAHGIGLTYVHAKDSFPTFTDEHLKKIAEPIINEATDFFKENKDITIITTILFGHPADEICSYAEEIEADLIIMGSHGKTGFKRFLLGSVANQVVPHSPCSVLVVKEKQAAKKQEPSIPPRL